jgi:hypothetical protein
MAADLLFIGFFLTLYFLYKLLLFIVLMLKKRKTWDLLLQEKDNEAKALFKELSESLRWNIILIGIGFSLFTAIAIFNVAIGESFYTGFKVVDEDDSVTSWLSGYRLSFWNLVTSFVIYFGFLKYSISNLIFGHDEL